MDAYFDQIYCINLTRCQDRKQHMIKQFAKVGLTKYKFIEAIDHNNPEVNKMFQMGKVKKFPPCFRCGQLGCNHKNKELSKSQVANWLSYRKVWKDIIKTGSKVNLICEDDLVFLGDFDKIIGSVFSTRGQKKYGLNFQTPTLVRLGWAKCSDHSHRNNLRVDSEVKMSNPCHAISLKMAKKLLSEMDIIDTTSDIFIHSRIGRQVRHKTVFPPVAYELSFGNNPTFRSEIMPKKHFLEKLKLDFQRETDPVKKRNLTKKLQIETDFYYKTKSTPTPKKIAIPTPKKRTIPTPKKRTIPTPKKKSSKKKRKKKKLVGSMSYKRFAKKYVGKRMRASIKSTRSKTT